MMTGFEMEPVFLCHILYEQRAIDTLGRHMLYSEGWVQHSPYLSFVRTIESQATHGDTLPQGAFTFRRAIITPRLAWLFLWSVDMKQPRRDPATGDVLTTGEYISWLIQGVIRRWLFLVVISIITALVWLTNNATALTWWNLGASYMALVIESIVGISMYSQTRRDATVLREVRTIGQRIEQLAEKIEGEEAQEVADIVKIVKRLEGAE